MSQIYQPDIKLFQKMMSAAEIGWWKVDFQTETLYFSDFLQKLLHLDRDSLPISVFVNMIHEGHRTRLINKFTTLRVDDVFDELVPIDISDEEIWVHIIMTEKQIDPQAKKLTALGSAQKITIQNIRESERLILKKEHSTILKENKHMELLLHHLPLGYFRIRLLYSPQGEVVDYLFISINKSARELLGVDIEFSIGRTALEIGVFDKEHAHILSSIPSGSHHEEIWMAERTRKCCRSILYNTPNDDSEIIILLLDITDTVNANKALDKSEKLLRNIFRTIPVGVEIYDQDGILVDVNRKNMKMFGFTAPEGMIGIQLFDNPNIPDDIKERIRKQEEVEFSMKYDFLVTGAYHTGHRLDALEWTARVRYLYDNEGRLANYLLINIDNTKYNFTQNRILEFESIFRLVSEYAKVGYANYNLYTKTGYSQEVWRQNYGECEGTPIENIVGIYSHVYPEDRQRLLHAINRVESGETSSIEETLRIIQPDGQIHWIKANLICRDYQPDKGIVEMVGINYDITTLKTTEKELISAKERAEESSILKSAFLANMSHEIRTPLNAIVGFSELLMQEDQAETRKEYMEIVAKNNNMLIQIISDVLDLARIESERQEFLLTKIEARELCKEVISLFSRSSGLPRLMLADGLSEYYLLSNKSGLIQVLSNFASNSLKFSDEGTITVGYRVTEEVVKFYVRDTGIGISKQHQSEVFERFYKVNNFTQGTGLGLSICKSIIEQLNGEIGVTSEEGVGSEFWFTLPLQES